MEIILHETEEERESGGGGVTSEPVPKCHQPPPGTFHESPGQSCEGQQTFSLNFLLFFSKHKGNAPPRRLDRLVFVLLVPR